MERLWKTSQHATSIVNYIARGWSCYMVETMLKCDNADSVLLQLFIFSSSDSGAFVKKYFLCFVWCVCEKFKSVNVYFVYNYATFCRAILMPLWATKLPENITFISAEILLFGYYSATKYIAAIGAYFHDENDEMGPGFVTGMDSENRE